MTRHSPSASSAKWQSQMQSHNDTNLERVKPNINITQIVHATLVGSIKGLPQPVSCAKWQSGCRATATARLGKVQLITMHIVYARLVRRMTEKIHHSCDINRQMHTAVTSDPKWTTACITEEP